MLLRQKTTQLPPDDVTLSMSSTSPMLLMPRHSTQHMTLLQAGVDSILAIDNPRKDLLNSSREVAAAVASFPKHKVLRHEEATIASVLDALPHCNILHLSCHSTANL